MTKRLLMGNEAFAHAALEAGIGMAAGYPGTPSSEVIETIARNRAKGTAQGIHVEWSTNEKAALEVAAAASMSGIRSLFTCKQMGLNVASDALLSLNYVGIRGGLVVFVCDDPGPISSQTEQDTRRFASFAKIPVLDPANPEQGFLMMKAAFDLSERFNTPVIVRSTTRISHASTFFDVADSTVARPPLPLGDGEGDALGASRHGFVRDPDRWVIFPKRSYQAHGEINERLPKIAHMFAYDEVFFQFNPIYVNGKKDSSIVDDQETQVTTQDGKQMLGIAASGDSASYALEALTMLYRNARTAGLELPPYKFIQVGTPYPIPKRTIVRFLKGLSDVLVLEELDSVLEDEMLKIAGARFLGPTILGKHTGDASDRGENSTEECVRRIAAFFDKCTMPKGPFSEASYLRNQPQVPDDHISQRRAALQKHKRFSDLAEQMFGKDAIYRYREELPARQPVMCAGCPHRGSFYSVKRALSHLGISRNDAIFCGDIGCYTLGNAEPLDAVDTCLCMGAGITMAQGFAATNEGKKALAFIGDSTFFASGMTGVANAVYNNHDITMFVLDNSTTAMTGMQPHPGTGVTLMGTKSTPIDVEAVLRALGVQDIHYANPLRLSDSEDACTKAIRATGPSAVIMKSPCVWLSRNERPCEVNPNKCTGCKKCIIEIGCPAISFDVNARGPKSAKRGQATIDPSQCNGCTLCIQVCPFQSIKLTKREDYEERMKAKAAEAIDGRQSDDAADADEVASVPSTDGTQAAAQISHDEVADPSTIGGFQKFEADSEPLASEADVRASLGASPAPHANGAYDDTEQDDANDAEADDSIEPDDLIGGLFRGEFMFTIDDGDDGQ